MRRDKILKDLLRFFEEYEYAWASVQDVQSYLLTDGNGYFQKAMVIDIGNGRETRVKVREIGNKKYSHYYEIRHGFTLLGIGAGSGRDVLKIIEKKLLSNG